MCDTRYHSAEKNHTGFRYEYDGSGSAVETTSIKKCMRIGLMVKKRLTLEALAEQSSLL